MKYALVLGAMMAFLALPTGVAADDAIVQVGHNRLEPTEVSISAGGTVTFHNQDEMPGGHSIVADDGSFESPALAKDDSWSHTFEKSGTYPYHIKEHPEAKGKIVVK